MEDILKEERVPEDFMSEYLTLSDNSNNAWAGAKAQNDYNIFKPYLEKMVEQTKNYYCYMFPNTENLYDEMLELYIESIKPKVIMQENDYSSDFDVLEQESWINDLLPIL